MLTGPEIIKQIAFGNIEIDPLDYRRVGANSVDLTLGDTLLVYEPDSVGEVALDMAKPPKTEEIKIPKEGFWLCPGKLYLGVTRERAGSKKYATQIAGRSSTGRLGLWVHVTAGFGDVGFVGHWTLELTTVHMLKVYPGAAICQIAFQQTVGARQAYSGRYDQSAPMPVASRLWKDFQ